MKIIVIAMLAALAAGTKVEISPDGLFESDYARPGQELIATARKFNNRLVTSGAFRIVNSLKDDNFDSTPAAKQAVDKLNAALKALNFDDDEKALDILNRAGRCLDVSKYLYAIRSGLQLTDKYSSAYIENEKKIKEERVSRKTFTFGCGVFSHL